MTTTQEGTQFDAADEAFFNGAYGDAPSSEPPLTLEADTEEETDERPMDHVVSERLRARRTRLTQAVAEIVATLALLSGTAGGMHWVRGPASGEAGDSSPTFQYKRAVAADEADLIVRKSV